MRFSHSNPANECKLQELYIIAASANVIRCCDELHVCVLLLLTTVHAEL